VEADDGFVEDQASLAEIHPRVDEVVGAVSSQFTVFPKLNARPLAGETWLYQTREALGAPSLFVYYEVQADEHVVKLLALLRATR
jgi:hypothetical protein